MDPPNPDVSDDLLFGGSETMQQFRRQVDNIADTDLPVLIEGESGTGKEVLARAIHLRSPRRTRAFIKFNCSAMPVAALYGEVLREKQDVSSRPENTGGRALIERADGGTVLFDEIGELDLSMQPKLITLLQDHRASRTNGGGVRVLCTTTSPLRPKIDSGTFRDDLYYRLNVINLFMPPLRDRRVDIPALASHFLRLYAEEYQRNAVPFSQSLIDLFLTADWLGNIRELENAVKRYVILGSARPIIADLQKQIHARQVGGAAGELSLKELTRNAITDCEYKAILTSLNRNHWNRRETAQELRISYRSLFYRMRQLGLPAKRTFTSDEASGRPHSKPE